MPSTRRHLFVGSNGGAEHWTVVSSLLATARLNSVAPYDYRKGVLERMTNGHPMSRIDELPFWNWDASIDQT